MQCADFEPRLQAVLDAGESASTGRLSTDPQLVDAHLASHAAECAACRQLLSAMLAVVSETAAMPLAACPAEITSRVLRQMQPPARRGVLPLPGLPPLRLALPLAAAATLALALPIWSWLARERTRQPELAGQTASTSAIAPTPSRVPESKLAESHVAQSRKTPSKVTQPWSLVPGVTDFSAGPNQDLNASLDGLGNDVREGLAPVTRSTAGALHSLWQAISPAEDSRS